MNTIYYDSLIDILKYCSFNDILKWRSTCRLFNDYLTIDNFLWKLFTDINESMLLDGIDNYIESVFRYHKIKVLKSKLIILKKN